MPRRGRALAGPAAPAGPDQPTRAFADPMAETPGVAGDLATIGADLAIGDRVRMLGELVAAGGAAGGPGSFSLGATAAGRERLRTHPANLQAARGEIRDFLGTTPIGALHEAAEGVRERRPSLGHPAAEMLFPDIPDASMAVRGVFRGAKAVRSILEGIGKKASRNIGGGAKVHSFDITLRDPKTDEIVPSKFTLTEGASGETLILSSIGDFEFGARGLSKTSDLVRPQGLRRIMQHVAEQFPNASSLSYFRVGGRRGMLSTAAGKVSLKALREGRRKGALRTEGRFSQPTQENIRRSAIRPELRPEPPGAGTTIQRAVPTTVARGDVAPRRVVAAVVRVDRRLFIGESRAEAIAKAARSVNVEPDQFVSMARSGNLGHAVDLDMYMDENGALVWMMNQISGGQ